MVGPVVEVGVAGGSDGSSFFSTLNLVLEGVLALTRRSCVEVGRGLMTIGRKGVSRSRRCSDAVDVQVPSREDGNVV